MKHIILSLALIIPFLNPVGFTQDCIPPEAEAIFNSSMNGINAKHSRWVQARAADISSEKLSVNDINQQASQYGILGNMGNMDIEAIAFLVLMQAAKDASNDLKSIMEHVKKINEQKKALRDALNKMKKDQADKKDMLSPAYDSLKRLSFFTGKTLTARDLDSLQRVSMVSTQIRKVTLADLQQLKLEMMEKLDSLNEMGEMDSLRLQMIMDRRTKMISMLSNLMKKLASTQSWIIQNMK